jgi:glycerophosphoryl diester phosphodiesterase
MIFPKRWGQTLVGAHRGASADAPENTIAAFDLAIDQGAELIECDVHTTLDGRLVIHHDFDLLRTAGRSARIGDLTLAEIESLDVGAWNHERYVGERVPTLDLVLLRYGTKVLLNLEIKVDSHPNAGIESGVAEAVVGACLIDRVVVSSFDLETILRLRRLYPQIRASLLYEDPLAGSLPGGMAPDEPLGAMMALAALYGLAGVHLEHSLVSAGVMDRARRLGLGVLAWTVDEPSEMVRLAGLGIDAIVSNRPALLRQVVAAHQA